MANIFFISDPHFGHANILNFTVGGNNVKLRDFPSIEEHDETIIQRTNAVVRPQDHLYILGDVAINKKHLATVKRLNGHKRLIMGNHDIYEVEKYLEAGFEKVMACRVLDQIIFTHIPIHEQCLGRFSLNVHGHMHAYDVMYQEEHPGFGLGMKHDKRYLSVCCEKINYTPISLEEIKKLTP